MFTGVDIGGTNTDIAVVGEDIATAKLSNVEGITRALTSVEIRGRLAVSTSQPLNRLVTQIVAPVHIITIPGPGLVYTGAVAGMVNHRGDILEEIDYNEISGVLKESPAACLAIAGKFSVRNSALEEKVFRTALRYFPPHRIAMSHHLGRLGFPERIATTAVNARIKDIVTWMADTITSHAGEWYFFKGDGGLSTPDEVLKNPSLLYNSSPAAVALGAYYLSGVSDCLVVDIGGTTTDLVSLKNGVPAMEDVTIEGRKTFIRSIVSQSLPYGGDSRIESGLCPWREGNALAFGGAVPTLTDALNVSGCSLGAYRRSHTLERERAGCAIETYLEEISSAIRSLQPTRLVGTGYLAPFLMPSISSATGIPGVVPEHSACANAVGVAVSRVSLSLHIHADSARRRMVVNGDIHSLSTQWTDEDLIAMGRDMVRQRALTAGAPKADVEEIEVAYFSAYDVVRSGRRAERIADLVIRIPPGITTEAP